MTESLISYIKVEKLFGLYTYSLPNSGTFSNASILYGDNGVGKSTILYLAFHLLSAANNRGHRTALYQSKFEKIEVGLASGYILEAHFKEDKSRKILSLTIKKAKDILVVWDYFPKDHTSNSLFDEDIFFLDSNENLILRKSRTKKDEEKFKRGEKPYIEILNEIKPTTYILTADRRLDSDSISDINDEVELRRIMHAEDTRRLKSLISRARAIALAQALNAASRWMSKKALQSANRGSENVHSVYGNVLRHLVMPNKSQTQLDDAPDIGLLIKRLTHIETTTHELSKYELATPLSTSEFRKALNTRSQSKKILVANLLDPYVESLNSRLNAVEPIFKLINKFVVSINDLLTDKTMSFKVSQGFTFKNRVNEPLDPSQLSSGEQQLLLLFCYVLVARDTPSVFMIDEPEISLNIKWQRQLIQSLLDITSESNIQFMFASHSMELLAQHRNRVVKLEDKA